MTIHAEGRPSSGSRGVKPIEDEWGLYDPDRAGAAAVARIDALRTRVAVSEDSAARARAVEPPAPAATLAPVASLQVPTTLAPVASPQVSTPAGALYSLEAPVRCPECHSEMRSLRVLRLLRTQVSFTSTLPRKGYVIVCPHCERMLSAELSGLV